MNADVKLDAVEKSIYRYYWEDGLIDLLLGVGLLLIGLAWLSGLTALTMLVPVVLLPVWIMVRKRITVPRAGHVLFSPEHNARTHQKLNITSLIGFALMTLFGALYVYMRNDPTAGGEWVEQLVPGLPAALLALGLLVTYLAFAIPRFVVHAVVLMAMAVVGAGADVDPGWQFLVAGVVISVRGVIQFVKFLNDFPAPNGRTSGTAA